MARRTHTQNTKKPRKRPYNGISEAFRWYEPLGPVPEVTAADQEDESFAAHAAIVADAAADCKRGKRANGALERASFGENGAFRRGSAGIRACEACAAGRRSGAKQAASNGTNLQNRWDCVPLPCFQGFSGFRPSVFAASSMGQKTDLQLNQNSAKNQAVPPWASASSAGPLFVAELPL